MAGDGIAEKIESQPAGACAIDRQPHAQQRINETLFCPLQARPGRQTSGFAEIRDCAIEFTGHAPRGLTVRRHDPVARPMLGVRAIVHILAAKIKSPVEARLACVLECLRRERFRIKPDGASAHDTRDVLKEQPVAAACAGKILHDLIDDRKGNSGLAARLMILAMAMRFALAPLALARLTAFESDKGANQCDAGTHRNSHRKCQECSHLSLQSGIQAYRSSGLGAGTPSFTVLFVGTSRWPSQAATRTRETTGAFRN